MSSTNTFNAISALAPDPKQLELVRRIIDRTREGKISWQKSSTDITANVANELFMTFVHSWTLPTFTIWKRFTVRDGDGHDFLTIDNTSELEAVTAALRGEAEKLDPVRKAVNELYFLAEKKGNGDIDKAISVLERV